MPAGAPVNQLRSLLLQDEGLYLKPYLDSSGKMTIGVGRNLEDVGISTDEAMFLLDKDITRATAAAATFKWFPGLDQVRKDVIVSMVFNMGLNRFLEFRAMIAALQVSDWNRASNEMLNSVWAAQVRSRAVRLADMMRSGQYKV